MLIWCCMSFVDVQCRSEEAFSFLEKENPWEKKNLGFHNIEKTAQVLNEPPGEYVRKDEIRRIDSTKLFFEHKT